MGSVAMVFCYHNNENASCLLWKPERKTRLTLLIKKVESEGVCAGLSVADIISGERNHFKVWILSEIKAKSFVSQRQDK